MQKFWKKVHLNTIKHLQYNYRRIHKEKSKGMKKYQNMFSKETIESLLIDGYSCEDIAKTFSISPTTLRKLIRYYELDLSKIRSIYSMNRKRESATKENDEYIKCSPELELWFANEGRELLLNFFYRLSYMKEPPNFNNFIKTKTP